MDLYDYCVVGGGCLRVSTALAFIDHFPRAKICLVEGKHQNTASRDLNKVIRNVYRILIMSNLRH